MPLFSTLLDCQQLFHPPSLFNVNNTLESQLLSTGASETMASTIGMSCEAEGSGEGDEKENGVEVPGYSGLVTKHG